MASVAADRVISIAELEKHAVKESAWLAVDGSVYDVTPWLASHPGGDNVLLLSCGRDATHLMESYHPFTSAPRAMMEKYRIGRLADHRLPVYQSPPKHAKFYATLCARVAAHFKATHTDPKNSPWLLLRAVLIYGGVTAAYFATFRAPTLALSCAFALLWGLMQSIFSLQFMHDASHTSLTHKPWVWRAVGATWDLVTGASFYSWLHQHTVGHHLYTNVRGADPDLGGENPAQPELRRVHTTQAMYWHYAIQHLYLFAMYPFLTFKFRLSDFTVLSSLRNAAVAVTPPDRLHLAAFWFGKLMFPVLRVAVPMALLAPEWGLGRVLLMNLICELVTGAWLAFNFQVSHVVPDLTFWERSDAVNVDWAVSQVVTAQNYSMGNTLATYLSGALNYQIEHHLFPSVNQVHYPAIAPIVQATCAEFGVPYKVQPSYWAAFLSHLEYLHIMSKSGAEPHYHY